MSPSPRGPLAAIVLLAAAPLWAHHSFAAEFDTSKPVTLQGKVTRLDWTNPHVYIWVDVADAAGKMTNWAVESASPNGLQRQGWSKTSLKAGDSVTIFGYMHKDQKNQAKTDTVTLSSGRRVFTGHADEGGSSAGSR